MRRNIKIISLLLVIQCLNIVVSGDRSWNIDLATNEDSEISGSRRTIRAIATECNPKCLNNGKCVAGKCECTESFSGQSCEIAKEICFDKPKNLPLNTKQTCTASLCTIACEKGYKFTDDTPSKILFCKNGAYSVEEVQRIPKCEPICQDKCLNGGKCIAPNLCECPKNFLGPTCEKPVEGCDDLPEFPKDSVYDCSAKSYCTVMCNEGFKFPDDSFSIEVVCKSGEWETVRDDIDVIPECEPICESNCLNGGTCIGYNTCQCTEYYRGAECQYNVIEQCGTKKLNFNGNVTCSSSGDVMNCKLSCPQGTSFEYEPESVYSCDFSVGQYLPSYVPQCSERPDFESSTRVTSIKFEKGELPPGYKKFFKTPNVYNIHLTDYLWISYKKPKQSVCKTWNGNKILTFDGVLYSHELVCSHVLVKDYIDETFSVVLRSCPYDSVQPCPHALEISLQNEKFTFENNDEGQVKLSTTKKDLPIPIQMAGLRVTKSGSEVKIFLEAISITITWDSQKYVQVHAPDSFYKRSAGLCGTLDGDLSNDFMSENGKLHDLPSTFVDLWRVNKEVNKDKCTPRVLLPPSFPNPTVEETAKRLCSELLKNEKIENCLNVFTEDVLMEKCMTEYRDCTNTKKPTECICTGMMVLVQECRLRDIKIDEDWRDWKICPINCPSDRVYKSCGPINEPSCGSAIITDLFNCREGCFCPQGTILNDGKCIRKENCPCKVKSQSYKTGEKFMRDCNTCVCKNGNWDCTSNACKQRCSLIGESHYTTFDGKEYNFIGKCSHYLMKAKNVTVETESVACSTGMSGLSSLSKVSCKSLIVRYNDNFDNEKFFSLKQDFLVSIDGGNDVQLPIELDNGAIVIRVASSLFIVAEFRDGLQIWWDGSTRAYIDAPISYRQNTKGLCGTFNSNMHDDFRTPEGDIETSVNSFAFKWQTVETCSKDDGSIIIDSCQLDVEKKENAEKICSKLLNDKIFLACSPFVDPQPFYERCYSDMCACESTNIGECACTVLASYATECTRQGAVIEWRNHVAECAITCPSGQIFEQCGDACAQSCSDLQKDTICKSKCIEGCRCPKGEVLSDANECVALSMCKCTYNGNQYDSDHKEVRPGFAHLELCECKNGKWNCIEASGNDSTIYPPKHTLKHGCSLVENEIFTSCEPAQPLTCKNMHLNIQTSTAVCHSGCRCRDGYVLDSILKKCVLPEHCSCHHSGRSYNEGDKIKDDCNTCQCKSGKWECTEKQCAATCSLWGDNHFTTFDGREYDFQGVCTYMLSKGKMANGDGFSVEIQNVLCGSHGVTCSKTLTVNLFGDEPESIKLSSDSSSPGIRTLSSKSAMKKMMTYHSGVYVVVELPLIGVLLKWDRGTRVYLRLENQWKGKVDGLCGNYNYDALDDFFNPSLGIESNPIIFGHSWKLDDSCEVPMEQIDSCSENPQRITWSQRKCGLLKSSKFAPCRSEVPVEGFYKRCIHDACSCDQGGDCECLCTAIAAYAQACSAKGVNIRWRTPDLCPMQCDPLSSNYSPCIDPCPIETCENIMHPMKAQKLCKTDTCVEGCKFKDCPVGFVYRNESFTNCVPKSMCKPICLEENGKTYYEGDIMSSDACHTCKCTRDSKICSGKPCPPPTIPTVEPITTTTTPPSGFCDPSIPLTAHLSDCTKYLECEHNSQGSYNYTERTCGDSKMFNPNTKKCDFRDVVIAIKPNCEKSKCPPGQVWSKCAIPCRRACNYYEKSIADKCASTSSECIEGCVPKEADAECSEPKLWRDLTTCVEISECTCIDTNGKQLRPGQVIKSGSNTCQCINNEFICTEPTTTLTTTSTSKPTTTSTFPTPPLPKCEETDIVPLNNVVFSASSSLDDKHKPDAAAFKSKVNKNSHGFWSPSENDKESYLQVTLPGVYQVYGVNIKGSQLLVTHYVKTFKIAYSYDGKKFKELLDDSDKVIIFDGSKDKKTPVRNIFHNAIPAKSIRIYPLEVHGAAALRVELLGCDDEIPTTTDPRPKITPGIATTDSTIPKTTTSLPRELKCNDSLGIEDGRITSNQIEFNSLNDKLVKMNANQNAIDIIKLSSKNTGWMPFTDNSYEFIKFDFLRNREITGVEIKGGAHGWVESFIVSYSQDPIKWKKMYGKDLKVQQFTGNDNSDSSNTIYFSHPINARYLKIQPNKWHNRIEMKIEIIGCEDDDEIPTLPTIEPPETTTKPYPCNICKGAVLPPTKSSLGTCLCTESLFFDGNRCVTQSECPCIDNHISHKAGETYLTDKCEECMCKLGGVPECKPKVCKPCPEGERRVAPSTCDCRCEACDLDEVLCPTSSECIPRSAWCNGIQDCHDDEIDCPEDCEVIICPPGTELKEQVDADCPKCEPIETNVVCISKGSEFTTFDTTVYEYDICDHLLAKDVANAKWNIIMRKNCSSGFSLCSKEVEIRDKTSKNSIILYQSLLLTLNGYHFETVGKQIKDPKMKFMISKMGDSLIYKSQEHKISVSLNTHGDAKVAISTQYDKTVEGLCGYYDDNKNNDQRMPNGKSASSVTEFGNSWSLNAGNTENCVPPQSCPKQVENVAKDICETVNHKILMPCTKVVNTTNFIKTCITQACEQLLTLTNGSSLSSFSNSEIETFKAEVKCTVLEEYVTECLSEKEVKLKNWRSKLKCDVKCPPTFVHQDCYRHSCELTCFNLQASECPKVPNSCFPGCYCPPGKVRNGDKCVEINECKDCICDGFGNNNYITYDRRNFTFNGNCTYLLTRDISVKSDHTFQIYVSIDQCDNSNATCLQALHIKYGDNFVTIQKNVRKNLELIVNKKKLSSLSYTRKWLKIENDANALDILIPEPQVKIVIMIEKMSYSVQVPSAKYSDVLEGLCGNCNGIKEDDFKLNIAAPKAPLITDPVMKFANSWLVGNSKELSFNEDQCEVTTLPICPPLPHQTDPCFKLYDESIFGKCHQVIDPEMYVKACHEDLCRAGPKQENSCEAIAAYARDCVRNDICINWRLKDFCPFDCNDPFVYTPCGRSITCDSSDDDSEKAVDSEKREGCYCPDDEAIHDGKCLKANECFPCESGHFPGDIWQKDPCTKCRCFDDSTEKCDETICNQQECEIGFSRAEKPQNGEEKCCKEYTCIDEVCSNSTVIPKCSSDQTLKTLLSFNNCTEYTCSCVPKSECKPPKEITDIKPGFKATIDTSGCCPFAKLVCDKNLCPDQPDCDEAFHTLQLVHDDDDCCDIFECRPPKDKCIAKIKGKEVLKNIDDTWTTDDVCAKATCSYDKNSTATIKTQRETCSKICLAGFEMKPIDGKCCGECVKSKCIFDNKVYAVGQKWASDDNCNKYQCDKIGDEISITSFLPTCPDLSTCSKADRYNDGCCDRCNNESRSFTAPCHQTSLAESETIGMIQKNISSHVQCKNINSIKGFTECSGGCKSGTKFDSSTLQRLMNCECCTVSKTRELTVELVCSDNSKVTEEVTIPTACECSKCGSHVV